jgi:predicted KAP-like P-loop ATPase
MEPYSNINADVPINTINDDELNRADFSIKIAESILNYEDEECLVLGLMGKWGSGKTSIRNMIFEHIESQNNEYVL